MGASRGHGRRLAITQAFVAATFVLGLGQTGCGPIGYVDRVTLKADRSVQAAQTAQADKYSPYYYTLAREYLHKAREEAAAADFQAANRFGRRADEAARKAKVEAIERAGKPIEQFHPNFGTDQDDAHDNAHGGSDRTRSRSTDSKIAPLVDKDDEDDEDAGAGSSGAPSKNTDSEDGDDEMPPGMGETP